MAEYTRFVVTAAARTGSNMLVEALNSHPRVRCFGEIFNAALDHVSFNVAGYDNFDARAREQRDGAYEAFLHERIFPARADVDAVGFKLLYGQGSRFPELIWRLAEQRDLRVVHLRRRNTLRSAVSWKIAAATDRWVERDATARDALSPANALQAARHPTRAAAALWRRVRPPAAAGGGAPSVTLPVEQCEAIMRFIRAHESRTDEVFGEREVLTLYYEDVVARPDEEFARAQTFVGVAPQPVRVTTRRQNPRPLRELLANYDELREALRDTPDASLFEE